MKLPTVLLVTVLLVTQAGGQQDETASGPATIYFKSGKWFKQYVVYKGEETPVGPNFEALELIMTDYPEALAELKNGIKFQKRSNRSAAVLLALMLTNQPILEWLMYRVNNNIVNMVGFSYYAGMIGTFVISYRDLMRNIDAVNRAVWLYNKAVSAAYYAKTGELQTPVIP